MPQEASLVHIQNDRHGVTGIALAASVGLGLGVMAGMILGEILGDVHSERVKGAVGRLRPAKRDATPGSETEDELAAIEREVAIAIADGARDVEATVQALGNGIVELTGSAPDAPSRQLAGRIAQEVPGADVVVNRILVSDEDGAGHKSSPTVG